MPIIRMFFAAGLAAASASVLAAPAQAQGCNSGICASSVSYGSRVRVRAWRVYGPAGYIHLQSRTGSTRVRGTRATFLVVRNPYGPTRYAVRTCVPVGYGQGACGPWAPFYHRGY